MKKNGAVYWICGLAGSGKTSVAEKFSLLLTKKGVRPILLDGDYIRDSFDLPKDYTYEGRKKTARIYSKITKMLSDQGFSVVVSVIAMFEEIFEFNRKNIKNYVEVFLDVPLDELVKRNKKKLYSSFYEGKTRNIVGLDIKAEFPKKPDIILCLEKLWMNNILNIKDTVVVIGLSYPKSGNRFNHIQLHSINDLVEIFNWKK